MLVGFFGDLFMTEIERFVIFGMAEIKNKGKIWRKIDNRFITKNSLTVNPERNPSDFLANLPVRHSTELNVHAMILRSALGLTFEVLQRTHAAACCCKLQVIVVDQDKLSFERVFY